ncbi:hypothetical protein [Methylosinus sp. KRF6]|uniref:hypothetical protein n=1 Tax=Methylosinus sp. KRF6 TaxID=2846853 RepID=UPI001C0D35E1|nr:hypothetical protein [Methylosinus sp. KRF6]MBU3891050.1 hypothetical protein [Methylosinus sp. KRF6]
MSSRFENYAETEIGRKISYIINWPDRILEYRLLSNLGMPAVQAIAAEVTPLIDALPDKRSRDAASQFCGWAVGRRLRAAGYEVVRDRGRVSDAPFKTGAVWHRTQPLQVTAEPGGPTEGGSVELGVERGKEGRVIGRWRLSITGGPYSYSIHEMKGIKIPLHEAFHDAREYAERYGFATLRVTIPSSEFSEEERTQILESLGL